MGIRPSIRFRILFGLLLGALNVCRPAAAAGAVQFNRDVRPILSEYCLNCHGFDDKTRKGGLRLDQREDALRGGKSGTPAILPGKSAESELVQRLLTHDPDEVMPPPKMDRQLSPAQVAVLRQWIDEGAPYEPHWAFIPPQAPGLPVVKRTGWARSPLDLFVLASMEREGLQPRPEADRPTLIRRVTLDLTGLPPTPEEIDAFLNDGSRDAYEKVVDRLLASSRYGERMAVDWLDAARYADTHGYHIDSARDMTAWRDGVIRAFNENQRYDQFTIEQLAGDLLPDATLEQKVASGFNRNHMINYEGGAIAEEYHAAYLIDRINTTATVWLGLTVACAQCHDHKYDPITMKDYYGLYAIFNGVPENGLDGRHGNAVPLVQLPSAGQEAERKRLQEALEAAEARVQMPPAEAADGLAEWETQARATLSGGAETGAKAGADKGVEKGADKAAKLPETVIAALKVEPASRTADQQATLRKHYLAEVSPVGRRLRDEARSARKAREEFEKAIPTAMIMAEMPKPRDTFILVRGQYDKKGDKVGRSLPSALPGLPGGGEANRLGLARWLVSKDQPLTARVTVNRFWQMYFGNGLVKSAENFGTQGDLPTNPDLLDWLAVWFRDNGWDVKAFQKLVVMSATYRQDSRAPRDLYQRDPENRWLARGPRIRLQAEFLRDLALSVSGLLDPRIGGPAVFPYQPSGLWEELMSRQDNDAFTAQKYVPSRGADLYRRTMYTFIKRTSPHPSLSNFDAPDRQVCSVRRPRTNTPLQALALMNDPTYVEAARHLAGRLLREATDPKARIERGFRLALGRTPTEAESRVLLELLGAQRQSFAADPGRARSFLNVGESTQAFGDPTELAAWTVVASTLLNLDETITKN